MSSLAPGGDVEILAERVRLRLIASGEDDASLYRALYTCPRVMAQIAAPMDEADAYAAFTRVCQHNRSHRPGHRTWIVERRADLARLGIVALHRNGTQAELGLMLLPMAWNGHTSRAALVAAVAHGFTAMGLKRIDADCRQGPNTRILNRLLLPLGFEPVAAIRVGHVQWTLSSERWQER